MGRDPMNKGSRKRFLLPFFIPAFFAGVYFGQSPITTPKITNCTV